jgi:glycosyltransferase involved in cell wall biosynthesis
MRVTHLIKAKQIGGAERHLLMLLPALQQRNIDVQLLVLVEPDNSMDELFAEAKTRSIPAERLVIRGHADLAIINRIRAKLVESNPDILHTHLLHADTFGMPAAKLAGIKYIITSRHNDDDFRSRSVAKLASGIMWNGFNACIAISESIAKFVLEVEGAPPKKVHTVLYGTEHQRLTDNAFTKARLSLLVELGLPDDVLLLGMACRMVEQKGVSYALEAMAQIYHELPNAHLVLAGDGTLLHELKHHAANLEISERVHFLGWRADVPQLLMAYDLFLMPSLWEGFGLVALEAMSKHRPVIASNVSALPELVLHQETGLLIPPKDASALADAIRSLANDRSLRAHMGLVAEDRVESQFSLERMAEETIAIYHRFVPSEPSTTGTAKKRVTIN